LFLGLNGQEVELTTDCRLVLMLFEGIQEVHLYVLEYPRGVLGLDFTSLLYTVVHNERTDPMEGTLY
jgi:hypothetical protein